MTRLVLMIIRMAQQLLSKNNVTKPEGFQANCPRCLEIGDLDTGQRGPKFLAKYSWDGCSGMHRPRNRPRQGNDPANGNGHVSDGEEDLQNDRSHAKAKMITGQH